MRKRFPWRAAAIGFAAFLMLVAPATAQAPTIEDRVFALEQRVSTLEMQLAGWSEQFTREVEDFGEEIDVLGCWAGAMAISKRSDNTLVLTKGRRQSKVYVLFMDRACVRGRRDDFAWPGFVKP